MKRIGNIIQGVEFNSEKPVEGRKDCLEIDIQSGRLVEYVFAKFFLLCRGSDTLFGDTKRLHAEKQQWKMTFTRNGFTEVKHIQKAMLKLEKHRHPNPPQLGEFLSWNEITSEDLNLLTKEEAYRRMSEFIREGNLWDLSDTQNMILEHTINQSDRFFLRNSPEKRTRPIFERNYEITVRNFISGKLKDIPKAIENRQNETVELEKQEKVKKDFSHLKSYEQNMPEIRKILGMNENGTISETSKRR